MILQDNLNEADVACNLICFYDIVSYNDHHANGPSEIYNDGEVYYTSDGNLHNTKGPAVLGDRHRIICYFLDGKELTKEEWINETKGQ